MQAGGDTIDFSQVSSYDFGEKGFGTQDLRLTANADITVKLYLVGAGGGTSKYNSARGGAGGLAEGTFTFLKDQHYMLRVGGNGAGLSLRKRTGGGDGTGNGSEGGGGGYTGLFIGSSTPDYTQANAILMAGGGGGGASDPATGGVGGGSEGGDSSNADRNNRGGRGGTQTAGGAGGSAPGEGGVTGEPGSALQGGNGPAGGGGGGYFGGGGGFGNNVVGADGGGGGGSGFMHSTLITDGVLTQGEGTVPEGVNGSFRIEIASTQKTVTTTVTGATTPNLSITTDDEASGVIRCKLTADGVQESPVFSRSVSYYVVAIRNVVKIEQYDYANGTATLTEDDLSDGSLSLSYDSHPGNAICLYAGEQDINVEMDLYGGKGPTPTPDINADGGDGGYSKIRFTMKKDEEYVLTGLFSAVNAPFLYRKGTLIACVGAGGAGAPSGGNAGGAGGGIGIAGEKGANREGGSGGRAITAGTGNVRAQFGSAFDGAALTGGLVSNDGQRTGTQGGDGASCTRGVYWREQGKAPCEDLGTIKFRTPNGTEISNTAEISRGYKSGYNAIQTAGGGLNDKSGDGGCGFTGGFGGDNRGGGGGSGYTDGSVTVVKTQLGGSIGPARVNIKLSAGNFFIDDDGRILIYASTDARDPETGITKTTGIVNYGDNACIDDARWQRFLDLARDGTQDYRLTVTENNSTVQITTATEKNIYKMMNANQHPLSTSLTDWYNKSYPYDLRMLAWDETTGATVTGGDYSMLSWSPASAYGYGFYGHSSNSFFNPTVYGYKTGINFWILPPGVPDF